MVKTTIKIKGMHCRSCEILIADKLKDIKGVKRADVNYKNKSAEIYSNFDILRSVYEKAIIGAGYEIGNEEVKSWINHDYSVYTIFIINLIIIVVLYSVLKSLGVFNINTKYSAESGLSIVFLIGITAGLSTCMALVGGLILGISAKHAEKHPEATTAEKFRPHLFFNLGRIISYFVLGGLIGILGKAFQLSGSTLGLLTMIVGLVMLTVGLQLTELFPRISNFSFTLPSSISKLFGIKKHHEKEYSHGNSMIVGVLTFFLPCGFTQAMQLYAMSTGSFWRGALIMSVFALGTAPGLLGIGGFTSWIKGAFANKFFKFAGVVVIVLALLNIRNGLNLFGIRASLPSSNTQSQSISNNVTIENSVQTIYMDQISNGYSPNKINIKAGLLTKWIINSKFEQSCATSFYVPSLNIRKHLYPGENTIEFTPDKVGRIQFSCLMGMYTGYLNIIN